MGASGLKTLSFFNKEYTGWRFAPIRPPKRIIVHVFSLAIIFSDFKISTPIAEFGMAQYLNQLFFDLSHIRKYY